MSERLVPTNDWVLLSPEIEHEEVTKGGLILPKAGQEYESLKTEKARREHRPDRDIQKTQSRGTGRYEVLAVGPGTFLDVSDDLHQNVFLRKPMSCAPGDVVLAQQGVVPVVVNGGFLNLAQDYSILAIIHKDASGPETLEPLHDYIFTKEADAVRKSTGGIYMPGQPDATGNQAMPDRWEVLGVGEGPWCLKQDKGRVPELARRPMPVKPGDELCFAGAGFQIAVAGAVMTVVQAYQVAGVFEATC
jgi:co-chaperonin GroES (HSP10)